MLLPLCFVLFPVSGPLPWLVSSLGLWFLFVSLFPLAVAPCCFPLWAQGKKLLAPVGVSCNFSTGRKRVTHIYLSMSSFPGTVAWHCRDLLQHNYGEKYLFVHQGWIAARAAYLSTKENSCLFCQDRWLVQLRSVLVLCACHWDLLNIFSSGHLHPRIGCLLDPP